MLPRSVLIVDDNPDFSGVAASILREEGYVVDECSDADAAAVRLKITSYDAIVLEPSPSAGFGSLLTLLSDPKTISHVVAATTEDDPEFIGRLNAAGVFCVLRKPAMTPEKLSESVKACCAGR